MMRIRRARPEDGPAFLALVQELADYEKLEGPDAAARQRLLDDAFGARPRYTLLVAEQDARIVAYAVLCEQYSTFRAKPVLYLEDLYVTPSARRGGVARALMREVAREAVARDCARVTWVVLDWNEPAQSFYEQLGAKRQAEWWPFVLDGDAMRALAAGAPAAR